jgi:hypothetical protein
MSEEFYVQFGKKATIFGGKLTLKLSFLLLLASEETSFYLLIECMKPRGATRRTWLFIATEEKLSFLLMMPKPISTRMKFNKIPAALSAFVLPGKERKETFRRLQSAREMKNFFLARFKLLPFSPGFSGEGTKHMGHELKSTQNVDWNS